MIETWAEILRQLPDAKLLMKAVPLANEDICDRIREDFAEAGINSERLDLRGHLANKQDHLLTYGECDIALDTFPYNGTTTTCEALWMGVPVVTLLGNTHPGRVGASLLTAMGETDWIANNHQDYIKIACHLAQDRLALSKIQNTLPLKMSQSPLTNAQQFTKKFEAHLFSFLSTFEPNQK